MIAIRTATAVCHHSLSVEQNPPEKAQTLAAHNRDAVATQAQLALVVQLCYSILPDWS